MTIDGPRTPWVHTTPGAIIVNGVIVAVVSAVVTWIINNAATLPWIWILATFGIVAVGVFVVLSLARRSLRNLIWRRPVTWIWSWRPVSYRRHHRELGLQKEAMFAEVEVLARAVSDSDAATNRLAEWAYEAIETVRLSIPDVTLVLSTQLSDQKRELEELRAELDGVAKTKPQSGRLTIDLDANKRAAAANLQSTPPLPRPRWHAGPDNVESPDLYVIQNMVPRSVAREVRIEADQNMDIIDAGHWEDLSTTGPTRGVGTFFAVVNQQGRMNSVDVTISWYDEKGVKDYVQKTIFPKSDLDSVESVTKLASPAEHPGDTAP